MHLNAEILHSLLQIDLIKAGWTNSDDFPGITHRQLAMNALSNSLVKKFHNDETDSTRDQLALALFLECNDKCQRFGTLIPRRLKEELVIGEMKSILYDFFNPVFTNYDHKVSEEFSSFREPFLLNLTDIASHFGLGNGSNIGSKSTDFYTKYVNSTMSCSNQSLPFLFRQAISRDILWADVEVFRHNNFGTEIVIGSRLSFVPKSRVISRTICTEPLLNMLFQKGIAGVLERRLKQVFCIDLSNQPILNSKMARIGSESGKFGTIDLSSASDSISLAMLEQILPPEPLSWLKRCRSSNVVLPDGTVKELHMISSMGNGYTFPLQTILFAALVTAVYRVSGIKLDRPLYSDAGELLKLGNYAVFGDDIIVDSRVYHSVVDTLELLGFSVNRDKSFFEGFFRESCGRDYYQGYNIRGVYIKKLNTSNDFYSAINRLNKWSTEHGILLPGIIGSLVRRCRFLGVPYDEADDAGIKVPSSLLRTVRRDVNGAYKYSASINQLRVVRIHSVEIDASIDPKDVEEIRKALPGFRYSSDGLLLCLLAGWLRNGHLGLRSLKPKAVLRRRVCPGWDNRVFARGVNLEYASRWKATVEANLVS